MVPTTSFYNWGMTTEKVDHYSIRQNLQGKLGMSASCPFIYDGGALLSRPNVFTRISFIHLP